MEEFKRVTIDVLKGNDLAGYIAEKVFERLILTSGIAYEYLDYAKQNRMFVG